MHLIFYLYLVLSGFNFMAAAIHLLAIGAILEDNDVGKRIALKKGVAIINHWIRNRKGLRNTQLILDIRTIDQENLFQASKQTCGLLYRGVVAIIGPSSTTVSNHVQAICKSFGIPYLDRRWTSQEQEHNVVDITLNLNPHQSTFSRALLDYLLYLRNWDHVAIIYDEDESLFKFEDLLNNSPTQTFLVQIRKWRPQHGNYMYVLKQLRAAKMQRFLVDIPHWKVRDFLTIASRMNMTTHYYSYVFTTWDVQRNDLREFKTLHGANITSFSLLPFIYNQNVDYQLNNFEIQAEQEVLEKKFNFPNDFFQQMTTDMALLFDGMLLLGYGLTQLANSQQVTTSSLSCTDTEKVWKHGYSLINYMRTVKHKLTAADTGGITGNILFDHNGYRKNMTITIFDLTSNGFKKFGDWNPTRGIHVISNQVVNRVENYKTLQNKILRVVTVESEPFVVIKERDKTTNKPLSNPSAWSGFCIELLNEIARIANFNYTVHLVEDNQYGSINNSSINSDGSPRWNGLIGELMKQKADLAVASLTITYEREKVIDFTTPFMSLGLSIIFNKPEMEKPHLFSFLQPLSAPVWGYIILAYVIVSFILFVIARFTPYEWCNPHSCDRNTDMFENQFSIFNSLWFLIGSLMQQDCSDMAPRAVSTRIISGIWWFFTLILISSYTANLAAFLTVERLHNRIENAEALSQQTNIKYGTLKGGSTYNFFKNSKIDTYRRMWNFMSGNPSVFVNNTKDGIDRVLRDNGKYAFILESTWNEYYTQRNCEELMQVGGLLDSKGYGIGLPKNSPFKNIFNEIILMLQDNQTIQALRRLYWFGIPIPQNQTLNRSLKDDSWSNNVSHENSSDSVLKNTLGKKKCSNKEKRKNRHNELRMEHIGGAFIFIIVGVFAGFFVSVWEFQHKLRLERSKVGKQTSTRFIFHAFCHQFSHALRCLASSRRPAHYMQLEKHEVKLAEQQLAAQYNHFLVSHNKCTRTNSKKRSRKSTRTYPHPIFSHVQGQERPYIAAYDNLLVTSKRQKARRGRFQENASSSSQTQSYTRDKMTASSCNINSNKEFRSHHDQLNTTTRLSPKSTSSLLPPRKASALTDYYSVAGSSVHSNLFYYNENFEKEVFA